jgi:hypothetical protein
MALLYPWATKEYLLWEMSIGQIILYHNLGLDLKYGKPPEGGGGAKKPSEMGYDELKAYRDKLREEFSLKYGEI